MASKSPDSRYGMMRFGGIVRTLARAPSGPLISEISQRAIRLLVGRQERLQAQLGHRDVDRGPEAHQRGQEPQLAGALAQAQRDREADVVGAGMGRLPEELLELGEQRVEALVGVAQRVLARRVDDMAAPLPEVHDPWREAARMQEQPGGVERRLEEL